MAPKQGELLLPKAAGDVPHETSFEFDSKADPQDIAKFIKNARRRDLNKRKNELKSALDNAKKELDKKLQAQVKAAPKTPPKALVKKANAAIKALKALGSGLSFNLKSEIGGIAFNLGRDIQLPTTLSATMEIIAFRRGDRHQYAEYKLAYQKKFKRSAALKNADKAVIEAYKRQIEIEERIIDLQAMLAQLDQLEEDVHSELVALTLRSSKDKRVKALMAAVDQVVQRLDLPALPPVK